MQLLGEARWCVYFIEYVCFFSEMGTPRSTDYNKNTYFSNYMGTT